MRHPPLDRQSHKCLFQPALSDAEGKLVVLCQAVSCKTVFVSTCGRGVERPHRVASSDPRSRHDTSKPFADVDLLAMRLSKFVHIMATNQVPPRPFERDDRYLDEVPFRHEAVEEL